MSVPTILFVSGRLRSTVPAGVHGMGTIPCIPIGTVLHNHPDTNSIVGADIYPYSIVGATGRPYGKKPLTCL